MSLLEFDSVELAFDARRILSRVYVKCSTGEIVGILGRNGSGKSSLLQIVFGSLKADYKSVRIDGQYLGNDYMKRRLIAYLPQDNLIPNNIRIRRALSLFEINAEDLLDDFPECHEWLDHYPAELSGGWLRVIETLLILKSKSPFCLLDEPFTGVTPVLVERLKGIIQRSCIKKGIIITDHLYRDVMSITDRLYLLSNGQTYSIKNEQDLLAKGYLSTITPTASYRSGC